MSTDALAPTALNEGGGAEPPRSLAETQLNQLLVPIAPTPSKPTSGRIPGFYAPLDLLAIRPPDYLVSRLLPASGITCLAGPSGTGKTFLALAFACSVATGAECLGYAVKRGRALYLAAEGFHGICARLLAWEKAHGHKIDPDWLCIVEPPLILTDRNNFDGLLLRLDQWRADHGDISLIVVDTLAQTMTGAENEDGPMKTFVRAVEKMSSRYRCAILVLHHPPKDTAEKSGAQLFRGHGSLYAALQCGLLMRPGAGHVELTQPKNKDDDPAPKLTLAWAPVDVSDRLGYRPDGRPITSCVFEPATAVAVGASVRKPGPSKSSNRVAAEEAIRHCLEHGPTQHRELERAVAGAVDDPAHARNALKTARDGLLRDGIIRKRDDGLWALTELPSGDLAGNNP